MAYVKEHPPSEVYHLTKKENLNSILEDGMIRRFSDTECWFCVDLQKMKAYMEQTVIRRDRSALPLPQICARGLCPPQAHTLPTGGQLVSLGARDTCGKPCGAGQGGA